MFNTMDVARRIRGARIAKDMTQTALADEMGVSYQAVSNWERGNSLPDIGKLPDLCRILGLTLPELLGDREETETLQLVMAKETVPPEQLAKVAPVMPPEQVRTNLRRSEEEGADCDIRSILDLAPYLDEKDLDELALRAAPERMQDVIDLAPYLSDDGLDAVAEKQVEKGSCSIDDLTKLAPYLSDEGLNRLSVKLVKAENCPMDDLLELAPYLSEKALDAIALDLARKGRTPKELAELAPYLSTKTVRRLAEEFLRACKE